MKKFFLLYCLVLSILIIGCPSQTSVAPSGAPPIFDYNSAQGLYAEGQYYLKLKDYEYALRSFQAIIDDFSLDALALDAQFMVAEILSNPKNPNQDLESALEEYQTLVEDYPNSKYFKKAQKKIEKIEKNLRVKK